MCIFCRSAGSVLAILCLISCAKPAVDEESRRRRTRSCRRRRLEAVVVTGGLHASAGEPSAGDALTNCLGISAAATASRARNVSAAMDSALSRPGPRQVHDSRRESRSRSPAKSRSRPSRSTSTPRLIRSVRASLNQQRPAAAGGGAHRGNGQLFPLRLRGADDCSEQPFSTNVSVMPSPWSPGRKLVRIGIKGYAIQQATRPRANLVFLIDTSGSMQEPNKLPLVKQSLELLVDELGPQRHGRDRHLRRLCRHRARADAGEREAEDHRR